MKKLFVLVFSLCFALSLYSQDIEMKPWSIGINAGGYTGMNPMGDYEGNQIYDMGVYQIDGRIMFNEKVGIKLGSQYNMINLGDDKVHTDYLKFYLHGVLDAGELMSFNSENLGLYIHAGAGAGGMWQKNRFNNPSSRLFDPVDEMITMGGGINYYIKINEQWSYNLACAYTMHMEQSRNFDMGDLIEETGINGRYMSFTLGVSYHFDI
ncbi:MAG: hypothetical protein R6V32_11375 [Bacteroidales bacterium]